VLRADESDAVLDEGWNGKVQFVGHEPSSTTVVNPYGELTPPAEEEQPEIELSDPGEEVGGEPVPPPAPPMLGETDAGTTAPPEQVEEPPEPEEPAAPEEPAEPAEPVQPPEPSEPTEPAQPAEAPGEPVDQVPPSEAPGEDPHPPVETPEAPPEAPGDGSDDAFYEPEETPASPPDPEVVPPDPTVECVDWMTLYEISAFNLVVIEDFVAGFSDVECRVLAGGDVDLKHFSVAHSEPGGVAITAGGDVLIRHATIHGQVVHGGDLRTESTALVDIPEGEPASRREAAAVNAADLNDALVSASTVLFTLPPNGATEVSERGEVRFTGNDLDLNVFILTSEQLSQASFMEIDVPAGATALVNIPGPNALVFSNFAIRPRMTTPSLILFNAPEAASVRIFAFGMVGSLLAPRATVDFDNGQMIGTLMVRSFPGDRLADGQPDGQMNCAPFRGTLCPPGPPTYKK